VRGRTHEQWWAAPARTPSARSSTFASEPSPGNRAVAGIAGAAGRRPISVPPQIQRDINGTSTAKQIPFGKLKIDFKKENGTDVGEPADERGKITFTPDAAAPESDELHFIQVVRAFDTSSGKDFDWAGTAEEPRNRMRTAADKAGTVNPGFYVDHLARRASPRTKRTDITVLPYVDKIPRTLPQKVGKRRGKTIEDAVLRDAPGTNGGVKFSFISSVKAGDGPDWYGSVLWGFEVFQDRKGISKIRGKYHKFREQRGATTDAALAAFDEFYGNRGASTAP
jgi:hypothetical protein